MKCRLAVAILFFAATPAAAQGAIVGNVKCQPRPDEPARGLNRGIVKINSIRAGAVTNEAGYFEVGLRPPDRWYLVGRPFEITVEGRIDAGDTARTPFDVRDLREGPVRRLGRDSAFKLPSLLQLTVVCGRFEDQSSQALYSRLGVELRALGSTGALWRWAHAIGLASLVAASPLTSFEPPHSQIDSITSLASEFKPIQKFDVVRNGLTGLSLNPGFDFTSTRQITTQVFQNPAAIARYEPTALIVAADVGGTGRASISGSLSDRWSAAAGLQLARAVEHRTAVFSTGSQSAPFPTTSLTALGAGIFRPSNSIAISLTGRGEMLARRTPDSVLTIPHFRLGGFSAGPPRIEKNDSVHYGADADVGLMFFPMERLGIGASVTNLIGAGRGPRATGARTAGVGARWDFDGIQVGAELLSIAGTGVFGATGVSVAVASQSAISIGLSMLDQTKTVGFTSGDFAYSLHVGRGNEVRHLFAIRTAP